MYVLLILLAPLLAYFLYLKVFRVYYLYYFYSSQGIATAGFPLPILNNSLQMLRAIKRAPLVKHTVLEEYWRSASGVKGGVLPPIMVEFSSPNGTLIISDPELMQELYVTKNRHMEKSTKMKRQLRRFTGNSMIFDRSNELWALKRKHVSAAFYKDKLLAMMNIIIDVTTHRLQKWLEAGEVNITAEISDMITECVLQCVFGMSSESLGKIGYRRFGEVTMLNPGQYLKQNFVDHVSRNLRVFRQYFDIFDEVIIGQKEKDTVFNSDNFRLFLQKMI